MRVVANIGCDVVPLPYHTHTLLLPQLLNAHSRRTRTGGAANPHTAVGHYLVYLFCALLWLAAVWWCWGGVKSAGHPISYTHFRPLATHRRTCRVRHTDAGGTGSGYTTVANLEVHLRHPLLGSGVVWLVWEVRGSVAHPISYTHFRHYAHCGVIIGTAGGASGGLGGGGCYTGAA